MAKKKNAKKSAAKKSSAKPASELDTINNEVLSAALSVANLPVLLKVCRLCEAKDGPFLNIFEADKMTAKKIETVMPFAVSNPFYICSLLKNIRTAVAAYIRFHRAANLTNFFLNPDTYKLGIDGQFFASVQT